VGFNFKVAFLCTTLSIKQICAIWFVKKGRTGTKIYKSLLKKSQAPTTHPNNRGRIERGILGVDSEP